MYREVFLFDSWTILGRTLLQSNLYIYNSCNFEFHSFLRCMIEISCTHISLTWPITWLIMMLNSMFIIISFCRMCSMLTAHWICTFFSFLLVRFAGHLVVFHAQFCIMFFQVYLLYFTDISRSFLHVGERANTTNIPQHIIFTFLYVSIVQ